MQDTAYKAADRLNAVTQEVRKAIVGKDQVISLVLVAFLSKGHVLMEDMPGVGKTTLALAFSKALGLSCRRVQFTPDVLPSDLTGYSIYRKDTQNFEFQPGALFCNLLLADEINRTSSKTQSALLESMEEGKVTVEGATYALPQPHLVIATENPYGSAGTQPLPESQLDRFLMRIRMGYPSQDEEVTILKRKATEDPLTHVRPVLQPGELLDLQQKAANIYVDDRLYTYAATLTKATREHPKVVVGVSPRGSLGLIAAAKSTALLQGRDYALPDDMASLCPVIFAHRMRTKPGVSADSVLAEILDSVPAPRPERR